MASIQLINKLVLELYSSGWLKKTCRIYCKDSDILNDFVQEFILILYEHKNLDKLLYLYESKGNYYGYIFNMIKNEWFNKKSKTHKLLRCEEYFISIESHNIDTLGGSTDD